jgi:glycerophosphoryl diester phosphodiesterase
MDAFPLRGPAEIIAHRGFSARAPENTVAALRAALRAGADAVEFDLHMTADGISVLLHDDTLDRTTDRSGPVSARTLAELGGADAGGWFSAEFAGEPVPPLTDALTLLAPSDARVYPEVKRTGRPEDLHRAVAAVHQAGLQERTVWISMDWDALDEIRLADPTARIGYIVERPRRADEALERATGDARALLDYDVRILLALPGHAERAHAAGVPLAVWTVNTVEQARAIFELGVPRITTNEVEALLAWRATLEQGAGA